MARCSGSGGLASSYVAISLSLMAGKLTPFEFATTRSTKYGARSA